MASEEGYMTEAEAKAEARRLLETWIKSDGVIAITVCVETTEATHVHASGTPTPQGILTLLGALGFESSEPGGYDA